MDRGSAFAGLPEKIKVIEYEDSVYWIDQYKPFILKIPREIQHMIREHTGTRGQNTESGPLLEKFMSEIRRLQGKGFFVDKPAEQPQVIKAVRKLSLEISSVCNFSCKYCYSHYNQSSAPLAVMSAETAYKAVDILCGASTGGKRSIDFFGGEPLLNFVLLREVVDYCRNKNSEFTFSLTTNATLITKEISEFLAEHNFTIVFSIDGPESVHNSNRMFKGGSGSYKSVLGGIELLKKTVAAGKLSFNAVMTRKFPFPDRIFQCFSELGLSNVSLTTVSAPEKPNLDVDKDALECINQGEHKILRTLLHDESYMGIRYLPFIQHMKSFAGGTVRHSRCGVGKESLSVATDGRIYPCHRFLGNEEFVMGDVRAGIDGLKREEYYSLYLSHKAECDNCWAQYICGGPCIYDSYVYGNSIRDYAPLKCERVRNVIELSAVLYGSMIQKDRDGLKRYLQVC